MRDDYAASGRWCRTGGKDDGREVLPSNVKPMHYDLTFALKVDSLEFNGDISITLDVIEDITSITLNSVGLSYHHAEVRKSPDGNVVFSNLSASFDLDRQRVTFDLPKTIPGGSTIALCLRFKGIVRDGAAAGVWRSSYRDSDGETHYTIATHFEPVDARSAFPCFDEPALKATFGVTLITNRDLTCLCNMPVQSARPLNEHEQCVKFQTSPLMSTYLLAFVIGEFNFLETTHLFRIPIRVYVARNRDVECGRFALELGAKTLVFFEEKLGVEFPLPKMDLVAVPGFRGAMEHWGVVTFQEDSLLWEEERGSATAKKTVAYVVQHELAHQWFGNMVTMEFWDGLWLNEGFATWAAVYANDAFFPDWNVWHSFLSDEYTPALDLDSLRSTHPVEVPVKNAADIGQLFDNISYSKGSSVLRMLADYLGEETFFQGVRLYLNRHKWSNTTTKQLWEALSEVSDIEVEHVMGIWTKEPGYPFVEVTMREEGRVRLMQRRFIRTGDSTAEEDAQLFSIPVTMQTTNGGNQKEVLFHTRDMALPLGSGDLVKINAGHVGFFRTLYSSSRLQWLGDQANRFPVEDRTGIVSDASALASAGLQSSYDLLALLKKFRDESDLTVWTTIISALDSQRWAFQGRDRIADDLDLFKIWLVLPSSRKEGWDFSPSDSIVQQRLKALLFEALATSGYALARNHAEGLFRKWRDAKEDIDPNLRRAVLFAALDDSDSDGVFDFILGSAKSVEERKVALTALGWTRGRLLQRTLDLILSDQVAESEMHLPLQQMVRSAEGSRRAWEWMRTRWDEIYGKVAAGGGLGYEMGRIVQTCTCGFNSREMVAEIREFFEGRDTSTLDRGLAQGLDESRAKMKWVETGEEDVKRWFRDEKSGLLK